MSGLRGKDKSDDKQRNFGPLVRFLEPCSPDNNWDYPERPGQLDDCSYCQGMSAIGSGGADNAAGIMNGQACLCTENILAEMEGMTYYREQQQRNRIQSENCGQGNGGFIVFRFEHRSHGRNCAASTDGSSE